MGEKTARWRNERTMTAGWPRADVGSWISAPTCRRAGNGNLIVPSFFRLSPLPFSRTLSLCSPVPLQPRPRALGISVIQRTSVPSMIGIPNAALNHNPAHASTGEDDENANVGLEKPIVDASHVGMKKLRGRRWYPRSGDLGGHKLCHPLAQTDGGTSLDLYTVSSAGTSLLLLSVS